MKFENLSYVRSDGSALGVQRQSSTSQGYNWVVLWVILLFRAYNEESNGKENGNEMKTGMIWGYIGFGA